VKKILITGGLGFLGSYSIERYKKEEYKITVVDNLSTNVIQPDDPICEDVNVIIEDVLKYDWNKSEAFDMILHLASPVGPVGVLKHSGKIADLIISDIYWAIEGALKFNCPLIFISTSEIYGYRKEATYLKENDDKLLVGNYSIRNEYSMAKLLSEIVLENTAKVKQIKYQILRPFNISGARQLKTGGFVLPTFVTQALSNIPITVFGNGKQVRAFTHVKDIVEGIYLTSIAEDKYYNQIWNIGNPDNISTIDYLAKTVKEKTKTSSEIIYVNPKTIHGPLYEEAWDKIPDATKIKDILKWNPLYSKDEIINDVITFYNRMEKK